MLSYIFCLQHSCEDINECETGNFGCSHICLNTFGHAFCTCPMSYTLSTEDYKNCVLDDVISEFTTTFPMTTELVMTPQQHPENLEMVGNVAECPPGSSPDSENSLICVEHYDCSVENGGCEHICIDSESYRTCSCRKGYELVNKTACEDINECESENGGCDQGCVNLQGKGVISSCPTHFKVILRRHKSFAVFVQYIFKISGTFFCSCKPGYALKDNKRICEREF